jgi:hypothetical protein
MSAPGVHYPHRIRLRGPWRSEPAGEGIRWVRGFGYPGRIDADERVWLTVAGVMGRVDVSLNGEALGSHEGATAFESDVTSRLRPRNELALRVTNGGESIGDVALEIRKTAYIRRVQAKAEGPRIRIRGEVIGGAERPLELYVLLDGHTAHYGMVDPAMEGRVFDVMIEGSGQQVRVELVDGASVWYAIELPVAA